MYLRSNDRVVSPHLESKDVQRDHCRDGGPVDPLLLRGGTFCTTGPENVYNSDEELKQIGSWNILEVPLEYEPTTMSMTLVGSDAW